MTVQSAPATPADGFPDGPPLRAATLADIRAALSEGVADFRRAPLFGLFFGGFFAVGGILLTAFLAVWDTPWAALPLMIAFPLIGPFAAVGLYEVSRRLSSGEPLSWRAVLSVVWRQKDRQLAWMAFVTLFIFWVWAYQVRLLLALFLGSAAFSSLEGFATAVLTTENGLAFLLVGAAVGAVLALVLFSATVIAMPLLVDRDLDIVTAVASSVAAVRRSPGPMLFWGVVVTLLSLAAMVPFFVGLVFVFPILGHATWRLYGRVVDWTARTPGARLGT